MTKAWVVDELVKDPNCRLSVLSFMDKSAFQMLSNYVTQWSIYFVRQSEISRARDLSAHGPHQSQI